MRSVPSDQVQSTAMIAGVSAMKNIKGKAVVSVLLAIAPCVSMAQSVSGRSESQVACSVFGGVSEQVCPTSFIRLIARPEIFSGRTIAVQGWPKQLHGTFYLFFDKSAADNNIVENALVCRSGCERLKSRVGIRTTLIGGFTTDVSRTDLFTPVGAIKVKVIREID